MMRIIGISGTNGSGKDTVGQMLAERHGWLFVQATELLRDEARRRGLPIEREVLRSISTDWRRKQGLGVLVDMSIDVFKKSGGSYNGLAIGVLRNAGEAQHLKDMGGILIWVDADPRIRYERIFKRQRSPEDQKTFEQFMAEEQAEMHQSGDEATLSLSDVKAKADIFMKNNGNDIEAFKDSAEKALRLTK